ncbi:hypothetical protein A4X06_0g7453 [Tilletia controversa]|uniref:Uncharacterized protein n=1 Tax=Tilletia controversa TaxID=13291 RepID=A0A8X7MM53_9BASI|nr:hypothetical protein A4X06_0g7453 [Tilletia controversa]CAD6983399.1 unnamed protein product [Tilletia controversa]
MAQQGSPNAASDGRKPTPTLVVTLTLSRSPTPSPSPDEPPLAQQRAKVDETFRIEKPSTPPAPKSASPTKPRPSPTMKTRSSTSSLPKKRRS